MKILVVNCGSSSVKSQVFSTGGEEIATSTDRVLLKVAVERIGSPDAILSITNAEGRRTRTTQPVLNMEAALRAVIDAVRETVPDIDGVGHRVVHGGETFQAPVEITPAVVEQIEDLYDLAPLHNPHNVRGYRAAAAVLPHARHVAVFDTSYHQSLPPHAFLYGLPYSYYSEQKYRRYGFHGVSHRYIAWRYTQIHGQSKESYRIISCHLGNGSSMCAIDRGKSIDTSMGFTPLEGLLMGTRCGDLDPSLVLHMLASGHESAAELEATLTRKSGLFGLSGLSGDMRTLLDHRAKGDQRAGIAIEVFCYRIRKYLGAYMAALNGANAIIFTGGIGENAAPVRAEACANLDGLGIMIDDKANAEAIGREMRISRVDSPVEVWTLPTNEELLIARDTVRCLLGLPQPE